MKYIVGRKQKRVILDENGHEVAICHKGKEEVAQQICDLLNEHGLVSKNESLHLVSQQSELLIGFVKYINDHQDYLKGKEFEEVVKEYLSHINCG